eukprot:jgi/Undpi1/11786/HiC_scaffold_4.g01485.m1
MEAPLFQDVDFGTVVFSSEAESKRQMVTEMEQTTAIDVACCASQTLSMAVAETQTDQDSRSRANPDTILGFDDWHDMPPDVAQFLAFAGATMEAELEKSDASQAFIGYAPVDEGGDNDIALHYTLSCDLSQLLGTRGVGNSGSTTKILQATGVDWSPTGSVVAASFGRNDIAGWCDSPGALATWNIFRRGFADEGEHAPDIVLDHSSCLMCVSCHPRSPAVVAAGSFNGEVVVWDTSKDEPLIGMTKIDDLFHREPVTSISWVYGSKDNDYRLAAVSGDGKLLFWSLKNNLECPVEGYRVPAEPGAGGRDRERSSRSSTSGRSAGCTSLSFLREGRHAASAVVGTEGGAVVKCRLAPSAQGNEDQCKSMRWSIEANEIMSRVPSKQRRQVARDVEKVAKADRASEVDLPMVFRSRLASSLLYPSTGVFRMEKHHGPVHSIDCSPFHRALVLSSGADGSARLYNTLQSRAVLTFEPSNSNIMDVRWSRARPLVFAAVAEDGGVFVYDLLQSSVVPVASAQLPRDNGSGGGGSSGGANPNKSRGAAAATVDATADGGSGAAVAAYSVSFNPRQRDLVATGDSLGRVTVWRMSWPLSNKRPGEDLGLERLFKGSVGDDETRDHAQEAN